MLDPFCGVGSTGIAALGLDRRFIGYELEPQYFIAAKKRIEEFSHPNDEVKPPSRKAK